MYITLTRKRLFVLLCIAAILLLVLVQLVSAKAEDIRLSTNAQRVEYIGQLGVVLEGDDYESKAVVIPQEFSSVYKKYNALQGEAGFNLSDYKGKKVTVYTYKCDNGRIVNLIIYKDKLIGGDIAETKLGGRMFALRGVKNG